MIKIYTDGSCIGNPGQGGWAAIILDDGKKTTIKGSKKDTTNKKEVSNKELWTELDQLNSEFKISWNWVKAHSTDELNNEVDLLARDAANL